MTQVVIGRGHIIESQLPTTRKLNQALKIFNGHIGNQTIKHIEDNICKVWEMAVNELTGRQYGLLMSVANQSYHDGRNSKRIDTWAYDSELDWLAGYRSDANDTDIAIEVDNDTITIRKYIQTDKEIKRVYKLVEVTDDSSKS